MCYANNTGWGGGGVKACVTTKCFAERNNVTILGGRGGQALRNNRSFFHLKWVIFKGF